jgi:hypothetical protein
MKTRNGIAINLVSKQLTKWEDYMPKDITREDIKSWKQQHNEALQGLPSFMKEMSPIDITYPGCYFADRCRKHNLLSEDEIQNALFNMGRVAFTNIQGHWKYVMDKYNSLLEE